jgi:hypothetical protein
LLMATMPVPTPKEPRYFLFLSRFHYWESGNNPADELLFTSRHSCPLNVAVCPRFWSCRETHPRLKSSQSEDCSSLNTSTVKKVSNVIQIIQVF